MSWRAIRWWLLAGLVLRLAWALYAAREPAFLLGGDQTAYLTMGRSIAHGHGMRSIVSGEPSAFYPAGYPSFVAVWAFLVERTPLPGQLPDVLAVVQAFVGAAAIVPTWWLGRAAAGPRAGVLAAALVALWPNLIVYTATFHLETVFISLLLTALALLVTADGEPVAGRRLWLAGLVLGLTVLVRPFAAPVVLIAAALRWWRQAAVLALCVLAVQVPWVIRNAVVMDAFVPTSLNTGDTLCIDHRDGGNGRFAFPDECFSGLDDVPADRIEVERNARNTRMAVRWVLEHPLTEAKRWVIRARWMLEHDHDALEAVESNHANPFLPGWSRDAIRVVSDAWWWALLPVSVAGAVVLLVRHRGSAATWLVLGTATVLVVIALGLYGYVRFHVPVLPFAAIAASAALNSLLERAWGPGRRGSP